MKNHYLNKNSGGSGQGCFDSSKNTQPQFVFSGDFGPEGGFQHKPDSWPTRGAGEERARSEQGADKGTTITITRTRTTTTTTTPATTTTTTTTASTTAATTRTRTRTKPSH